MKIDPKFIITEDMLKLCTKFAEDSVQSSADAYARRNQSNIGKITKDIVIGKLGEFGVYEKISKLYPTLSRPDTNIYQKGNKSWDPDLTVVPPPTAHDTASPTYDEVYPHIRIGVKSQGIESKIAYGESWVFQHRAGKNYDNDTEIFGNVDENHYVAFVGLNLPKKIGEIRAIVKVKWLHENKLFEEMKLKNLQGNKKAVYFESLERFKDKLWQL
jgi:hypothetical protein